jgi:hypothetical protein
MTLHGGLSLAFEILTALGGKRGDRECARHAAII